MNLRLYRALGITAASLLLAACPPADPVVDIGMTDTLFVKTMVRLRKINGDSSIDSVGRDSARRTVLRQQGVTVGRLDTAAKLLAGQPARAESVWKAIEEQMHPKPVVPPAKKLTP